MPVEVVPFLNPSPANLYGLMVRMNDKSPQKHPKPPKKIVNGEIVLNRHVLPTEFKTPVKRVNPLSQSVDASLLPPIT